MTQEKHEQEIQTTDSISEAGRKIFADLLVDMKENEFGSRSGEDIESVHQMRVASRKMRSLFKIIRDHYKPKAVAKYSQGLRNIGNALGEIRDLDVLIEDMQAFQTTLGEDSQVSIKQVIKKLDKKRHKNRVKLCEVRAKLLFPSSGVNCPLCLKLFVPLGNAGLRFCPDDVS